MSNTRRRIRMSDIRAVSIMKLLLAALIGLPVGAVLAFIFAVAWLSVLPAGDLILLALPIIGGIGGLILGPFILVRRTMEKLDQTT